MQVDRLEKRINEGGDGRPLRQRDEQPQDEQGQDHRQQPIALLLAQKAHEISGNR